MVVGNLVSRGQQDVFGLASDLDHLPSQDPDAGEQVGLGQVCAAVGVAAGGAGH